MQSIMNHTQFTLPAGKTGAAQLLRVLGLPVFLYGVAVSGLLYVSAFVLGA